MYIYVYILNQHTMNRWMILADGQFKRGQAGRNHFNSKNRRWKRQAKRAKVLSTSTQSKKLRQLIPYFKKKYMK